MKRLFFITLILSLVFTIPVMAADTVYKLVKSNCIIYSNGNKVSTDLPLLSYNNNIYVPLNKIIEITGTVANWSISKDKISLNTQTIQTKKFDDGKYVGTLKNGVPDGYGKYMWNNGDIYEGQWVEFNRAGSGSYIWANGDKYVGSFKNGEMNGQGTYYFSNGDIYVGSFIMSIKSGVGTYISANGAVQKGMWGNNELITSTITSSTATQPENSQPSNQLVTGSTIESRIDGEFQGWSGSTIFKLQNGQIWQQSSYAYKYVYKYSPKVLIYKSGSRYKMQVDGVEDEIYVIRIK